jgi:hypothetical protein
MPIQSEGTGPYFTPDEETLFVNVQHPGEESSYDSNSEPGSYEDVSSYWPTGNKSVEQSPALPLPATVFITRVRSQQAPGSPVVPPPPAVDTGKPDVDLESSQLRKLKQLRTKGVRFTFEVDEPSTLTVTLSGRLRKRRGKGKRGSSRTLSRGTVVAAAGEVTLRLRPSAAMRVLLRRERRLTATLRIVAVDRAGNRRVTTHTILFT